MYSGGFFAIGTNPQIIHKTQKGELAHAQQVEQR